MPPADDFAETPKSITEIRSDRDGKASSWTPRDVLVALLRDIDSGKEAPTALVVCYAVPNPERDGARIIAHKISSPDIITTIAMLEGTKLETWGTRVAVVLP